MGLLTGIRKTLTILTNILLLGRSKGLWSEKNTIDPRLKSESDIKKGK